MKKMECKRVRCCTKPDSDCNKNCKSYVYEDWFEAPRGRYVPNDCRERKNDPNNYSRRGDIGSRHSGHPGCD